MSVNKITKLNLDDNLPLTCTRVGTCCHGNQVLLNPWELFIIAKEKKISSKAFQNLYCELGGIRLKFNGQKDNRGKSACSQYVNNFGCSVHVGRPLPCRLFPIGRQIQNNKVHYIHQGDSFPCLNGCPEVLNLPKLTVNEYVSEQKTHDYEIAHDLYLDLMQNLADFAFEFLLEYGLSESKDFQTLKQWYKLSVIRPENLLKQIGEDWINNLLIPELTEIDPLVFVQQHNELIQLKIQTIFGQFKTNQDLHTASVTTMGLAIHLARALGANPESLVEMWIEIAKQHGAVE